jgi:hypothetical protein
MPLIPKGLGSGLFDRIRTRVVKELGGGGDQPYSSSPGENRPEDFLTDAPGLFSRVRDRIRDELGFGPRPLTGPQSPTSPTLPTYQPPQPPQQHMPRPTPLIYRGPPRSLNEVMHRIQEAGRKRVLLYANYQAKDGNPIWRHMEPYSFRYRDSDSPWIPLVYCFCHKDTENQIEAFKLRRFHDLQVTDQPFTPKWPVEF